MNLTYVTT